MPSIKKILFPVDFSEKCIGAARYVEAFAGRFEAELMLLHVVTDGEHTLANELFPMKKAQLESFLADELKYYSTQRICVLGDPAEEIVETANSWQPDLVMMPTFGVGRFRRLLLGSTTAKILHDLDCAVWTDVHSENAPPLEAISCRKIVCGIGLDERSRCILKWAAYLAGEYQAELAIVHALPAIEAAAPARFLDEEFSASLADDARKRLRDLQTTCGVKASTMVEAGDPGKVVANAAREFDADLVVIGRHAQSGLAGHLRQNAYGILRDSPCPVLSV
jgi:nucleotide-binding universal stress UspA family protein